MYCNFFVMASKLTSHPILFPSVKAKKHTQIQLDSTKTAEKQFYEAKQRYFELK